MRAYDIIKKKRDAQELSPDEMRGFLGAYLEGSVPDYQMSAFLMAVYFNGMGVAELGEWTRLMLHSGEVLDLSAIKAHPGSAGNGQKIDKHSTGGVGDKISLPLAPLAAACGVIVPMISGRGLGHTGGTLDKLESIPGFNVNLDLDSFKDMLAKIGVSMIGQTAEIAPADKRLYALRDVTATVDSIPLIASSIMSKKLAEGIDGLVLDVKSGSGAFMKNLDDSRALAKALLSIAGSMGKRGYAYVTDMSQPLGAQVGNSLEVAESIETLRGQGPEDVTRLTLEFAAAMIVMAGIDDSLEAGRKRAATALYSGEALQRFQQLIEAQGGDPRVCDDIDRLPLAAKKTQILAPRPGFVAAIDTEGVGIASMMLGAGRTRSEDDVDPAVGLTIRAAIGQELRAGDPLAVCWHHEGQDISAAEAKLLASYTIGYEPVEAPELILDTLEVSPPGEDSSDDDQDVAK